jgi:phosphocarrier protein FPr
MPVAGAPPGPGIRLTVGNRLGLHARPAARFVQTAGRYPADIRVRNLTAGRGPVSGKSVNAVATLGVRQGHEIEVTASGPAAAAALAAIRSLAESNFGDAPEGDGDARVPRVAESSVGLPAPSGTELRGLPASPGIGIGPARLFCPPVPPIADHPAADPPHEWDTLVAALEKTRTQLQSTRDSVAGLAGPYAAAIFDAHLLFLDDEALREPARRAIFDEHLSAPAAWLRATGEVAAAYRALDDEYQRARATDVIDVGNRVVRNLLGDSLPTPAFAAPGVLVAAELTPAETARLDPDLVLGICTAFGAPTSHSAILARTLGIPAVVGLGEGILATAEGTRVIVDGDSGQVWLAPDPAVAAEYGRRAAAARAAQALARAESASAAQVVTRDGHRVEVAANIGSPADARAAVAAGAEGVGLFRTEFLFLDRRTGPDEETQFGAYRAAAQALGGRPLIIRTLDAGGDKALPYLDVKPEANPFLGVRAIRLTLARPDLFKTQCRAIVRVAAEFPVKVMFPMITTLAEWRTARALLADARTEVERRGRPVPERIETGMMVEVPAAALRASAFALEVDFFSIGTNDLTQYTMAAERGNQEVAALADAFHPAVLQLIGQVADAAHARGKWVGVCGELAGESLAVPILVGLGVDELSMNPPAVLRVRKIVEALDYASARALAQTVLQLETADAAREHVRRWSESRRSA